MIKWQVRDIQTNRIAGIYTSLRRAHRKADKLDLEYGAVRYVVERVMVAK